MKKSVYIKIEDDFIYITSKLSIISFVFVQIFILFSMAFLAVVLTIFTKSIYLFIFFSLLYIIYCIYGLLFATRKELFLERNVIINKKNYTIGVSEFNNKSHQEYIGKFKNINIEIALAKSACVVIYGDISTQIIYYDSYWSNEFTIELENKFTPVAKDLNIPITNSFTRLKRWL